MSQQYFVATCRTVQIREAGSFLETPLLVLFLVCDVYPDVHTVAPKRIETYGAINEEEALDGESEVVAVTNFEQEHRRQQQRANPLLYSAPDSQGKTMEFQNSNLKTPTNDKSGPHRFTSSDFEPQFQPIQTPKVKRTDSDIVKKI